jgi:hypothetical protein
MINTFDSVPSALPEKAAEAPQIRHQLAIVRHLAATMMLGQMHGDHANASRVYAAVAAMLGNGRSLRVSLALASAIGGDPAPANELLQDGVRDWPEAEPAMVAVALALKVAGEPSWASLIDETLSTSVDPVTRQFAQQVQLVNTRKRECP